MGVCSNIFVSSNAAIWDGIFKKQREDVQATFNIPEASRNSIENLRDSDPVNVIIKTADNDRIGGSSMIKSMSMNVAMEIESAGIIAATVTKKDMQYLAQQPNIQSIEVDTTVYALEDTAGYVRNLAEDAPFGIPMVLEDMNFWKELGAPSGSIKVCVADTGAVKPALTRTLEYNRNRSKNI